MKILYDYQIFDSQKIGGISRYFAELIRNLTVCEGISCEVALRYSDNLYLRKLPEGLSVEQKPDYYKQFCWGNDFPGKGKLYRIANALMRRPAAVELNRDRSVACLSMGKYDIFHPTYYDDYFLRYIGSKPFVLTVYDMIHETFPECFPSDDLTSRKKKDLARKAARIIAISESTKRDVVRLLDVPPEKVRVIYLGSSLCDIEARDAAYLREKLPGRYILFVGDRSTYKNFAFFTESIAPVLKKDRDLYLVCAGARWRAGEEERLSRLGIHDQTLCYTANDSELACLYRNALAFVFPSLYEGFGMPVLEAFNCGCPAVVSRTSSFPEVGGDAVECFDPRDASSIRASVSSVIYDERKRSELRAKGTTRLEIFSWEKTARETYEVYRSIIG